ncbi:hypothetical protein SNE26_10310 [Mucilaginibacter sp. cycad4]|uniref:hypothetical protein n=1 Tax=Mucilaginibacter sp. cycad4 TaxID=3342096 RepID=UPI002AAB0E6A|nr:hypothetical protein [Mucilaginibacter gossypii]WPV02168.1 hypothetical protein SNE26_10310 [Mucilaginibacter gossypii]
MISNRVLALFNFIDFLDQNKALYIGKYLPLCDEIKILDKQRRELKPALNYIDKQKYDVVQKEINEKIAPVLNNVYKPIVDKLIELEIWSGDSAQSSIWNNSIGAISDLKQDFGEKDIAQVMIYKRKYLEFRAETNSNFLSLQMIFQDLDQILKELFDFFKDTNENEFREFEAKTIKVDNIEDALLGFMSNQDQNVKFSIPTDNFFKSQTKQYDKPVNTHINNEIIMGHKIEVGDIKNNSGSIVIGNDIQISDSLNGKKVTADKIGELLNLLRNDPNLEESQKQTLITNFDKVKEEVLEAKPDKSKIFKWLSNTKGVLENLVLTHHVNEAIHWVYENLNFFYHQIKG